MTKSFGERAWCGKQEIVITLVALRAFHIRENVICPQIRNRVVDDSSKMYMADVGLAGSKEGVVTEAKKLAANRAAIVQERVIKGLPQQGARGKLHAS